MHHEIIVLFDLHFRADPPMNGSNWGYCPQKVMIIDCLNLRRHILLFGYLRGLGMKEAEQAVDDTVYLLKLNRVQNRRGSCVSKGQQKMTNLGMAIIGYTKILVLDEPTVGSDSEVNTSKLSRTRNKFF